MRKTTEVFSGKIIPVLHQHGVIHAAFFGSFARGDEREDSDVDILVEFEEGRSLLDLAALKLDLEDALAMSIDVVTYNSLSPKIRKAILNEQMIII